MTIGDALALLGAIGTIVAFVVAATRKIYAIERDISHAKRSIDAHGIAFDGLAEEVEAIEHRLTVLEVTRGHDG